MSPLCNLCMCFVTIILHGVRSQAALPCSNPISRTMDFSLASHKDNSGRWVAEVEMEHDADARDSSVWKVDVKHSTVGCAGSSRVKVTAKITAPPPKLALSYELYRGIGYYKLHTTKKNWHDAKATCESEGAHLAILNSEPEAAILLQMYGRVPQNESYWAFVGFHDMYTEGQYLTIHDEPLNATGFTRWSSASQPDNSGGSATNPGEDCGSINHSNGGLNDLRCLAPYMFFCEQEIA